MKYRVGCVPYANAYPLVAWFNEMGLDSPVEIVYEVPSALPSRLESGELDAILVSSVDALRVPGRRMAENVCIGSDGEVQSVRLFSQVPFEQIKSLAWDQSSMTSNRLAVIILREKYGITPNYNPEEPDIDGMLNLHDACIIIGDLGMAANGEGLHVLDLGSAWKELTGKGFVWAAWLGKEKLTPELALLLTVAASRHSAGKMPESHWLDRYILRRWQGELGHLFEPQFEQMLDFAVEKSGWERETLRKYYREVIVYELSDPMLAGLKEFQQRLFKNGFEDCVHFPAMVSALGADMELIKSLLGNHFSAIQFENTI